MLPNLIARGEYKEVVGRRDAVQYACVLMAMVFLVRYSIFLTIMRFTSNATISGWNESLTRQSVMVYNP